MLGKLIKHELKATCRYLLPLCLILLVLSLVTRIVISLEVFEGTLGIIPNMAKVTYIISIVVLAVAILLIMIFRFYKNLLTEEGYLMFTLPVRSDRLINSKLIVAMMWTLAGIIAVIVSLMIAFATPESMKEFFNDFDSFMAELGIIFSGKRTLLIIEFFINVFLGLINNILLIYVSIAVGQLFTRHKIAGSLIAYLCINVASELLIILIIVIAANIMDVSIIEVNTIPDMLLPLSIVITLIFNYVFYYATYYIFRKKLNLD